MKKLILITLSVLTLTSRVYAQQPDIPEKMKGTITEITVENNIRTINIQLVDGNNVTTKVTEVDPNYSVEYFKNDKVVVQKLTVGEETKYIITDFDRLGYLGFLFFVFVVLAIVVGKKYGIYSLLGMGLSFLVILKFILPQITKGGNPVFITVVASIFIIPITFYLSHGINKKTHVAVVSTFISLVITSIFAAISVNLAKLTGFSSDEAMFLKLGNSAINMKGILLSGIIIGFLGVMDDVTVSQAAIVTKLAKTKRNMNVTNLYKNAMDIGKDHITSMINTLIFVYAGASLPLLLMFIQSDANAFEVLNTEIIADEIVRTLVGSIGLIISVPIATLLAALTISFDENNPLG
jgi:uncharacterized membrane protein